MPVVVPSAPEVQETTRMLEDSESVSSRVGPECGVGSLHSAGQHSPAP